jgi:hypothetical protein
MGSLDRSEFCMILLEVYFLFKIHFKLELFQNGVRLGALKPWISSWRRISRRAICFSVVVGGRRWRGEVALAGSTTK